MFKYQLKHKNNVWAFIDGLLASAITVGFISHLKYQNLKEKHERAIEEAKDQERNDTFSDAFKAGFREGKTFMLPYIKREFYDQMYPNDKDLT